MIRLHEDQVKAWLRGAGLRVPQGEGAATPDAAAAIAERIGGETMVKSLVPAGRRGKAGAIIAAGSPADAAQAARRLLGSIVGDYVVRHVYVEQRVTIASELYVAFLFDRDGPRIIVSAQGGVEIEAGAATGDAMLIGQAIDPLRGLAPWEALALWHRAGLRGAVLRELGAVTARLWTHFRGGDAELLEINPLAIDREGHVTIVGAMAGIDADAIARHPEWRDADARGERAQPPNPREARIEAIDRAIPGGECRYVELDGDIALLVGGGGAGLYQHDRMLAAGGRPANHSVTPPTGSDHRKLKAVIEAIFDNPNARALLVGFNFAQMARADIRVRTLLEVIAERGIDTARFPIVIRLFGAGESDARAMVAGRSGIHYVPRETSLDQAIRLIVALAAKTKRVAAA